MRSRNEGRGVLGKQESDEIRDEFHDFPKQQLIQVVAEVERKIVSLKNKDPLKDDDI